VVSPYPIPGGRGDEARSIGDTYAAVVIAIDEVPDDTRPTATFTRADVLAALQEVRFSGWVGQPENGWTVAVAAHGSGTVAAGRRGVVGVGEWLAARLPRGRIVAIRVVEDRQLLLVGWVDGLEVGRYLSDPSYGLGEDDDTLSDPYGVDHATAFATACGHAETAEDLAELLAEELDPDSVNESERLSKALRLLALPTWLVAAASLPRDIPTGPRARDLTRLGAGRTGLAGWVGGWAVDLVRRHRRPPPAVTDAPRGSTDIDPWYL
jgi:hypothetical protein